MQQCVMFLAPTTLPQSSYNIASYYHSLELAGVVSNMMGGINHHEMFQNVLLAPLEQDAMTTPSPPKQQQHIVLLLSSLQTSPGTPDVFACNSV